MDKKIRDEKGRFVKGFTHSEESKRKISQHNAKYWLNKNRSEGTKRKISLANKGKGHPISEETKRKISKKRKMFLKEHPSAIMGKNNPFYNKHHTEKAKMKNRLAHLREKCNFWKGGKSFEPYTLDFNNLLKEQTRQKNNFICQSCGLVQNGVKLDVHHVDYNKKNCSPDNLITLCRKCHRKTNSNRNFWIDYFNNKRGGMNS